MDRKQETLGCNCCHESMSLCEGFHGVFGLLILCCVGVVSMDHKDCKHVGVYVF